MTFSMWIYPWDLLDEGVEQVTNRLVDLGIDEINIAMNYHNVQAFLPHNPKRKTFFAYDSCYFQPGDKYGKIKPVPNEAMGDEDWLDTITDELHDAPIDINCWLVGCRNSRLGMQHHDITLKNCFGDPLVFGMCPSNPDVLTYLENLVTDVQSRGTFKRVELETFNYFFGNGFNDWNDKFHTRFGVLGDFLWGLCFCDHCVEIARKNGIDVEEVRKVCQSTLINLAEGKLPYDIDVLAWLTTKPMILDYTRVRMDTLETVYKNIDSLVQDPELGIYVGLVSLEKTWMQGVDLNQLSKYLDYTTVLTWLGNFSRQSPKEEAVTRIQTISDLSPQLTPHAGVLPGHPMIHDKETVQSVVDGVIEAGAERVSFYNYGLLPEKNLEWIKAAISS